MKTKFLAWLVIIILVSSGLAFLIYSFYAIYSINSYDMNLEVSDVTDLNLEEGLDFGKIAPGGAGEKRILLEHVHDKPLFVVVRVIGDLSNLVSVSDNGFWLEPGKTKEISVFVYVPEDAEYAEYDSELKVILRRI